MFKKITLENGLRIIAIPQKSTQAVTILVLVGTGSKYEKKELNGISHFLEHMFFKGTKKRPSFVAVAETLDKLGGIYNAFTGHEYTGYYAKVAAPHFETALDWVSDIFFNSLLPEKEIKKEKKVIIEEINMYYDHPMNYVGILWLKLLYGDQPAGLPVSGTKESVVKISRQDLLNYFKNQYTAQNTLICIAGNIKEDYCLTRVKKYFSKINKIRPKEKSKVIEKQTRPDVLLDFRKTDQTHFCLGVRAFNLFHPQRYAQDILSVILGEMMSSRLFLEIRQKLGIAYYITTSSESDTDTGSLVTQAGVDNQKVDLAILTVLREYKKLAKKEVSKDELKKAKDYIKGKMALILETSDARASFYGLQELLEKKILTPEKIYQKIDGVSQADILKVAGDVFRPKNLNLTLVGPYKDKKGFEKILQKF